MAFGGTGVYGIVGKKLGLGVRSLSDAQLQTETPCEGSPGHEMRTCTLTCISVSPDTLYLNASPHPQFDSPKNSSSLAGPPT